MVVEIGRKVKVVGGIANVGMKGIIIDIDYKSRKALVNSEYPTHKEHWVSLEYLRVKKKKKKLKLDNVELAILTSVLGKLNDIAIEELLEKNENVLQRDINKYKHRKNVSLELYEKIKKLYLSEEV